MTMGKSNKTNDEEKIQTEEWRGYIDFHDQFSKRNIARQFFQRCKDNKLVKMEKLDVRVRMRERL